MKNEYRLSLLLLMICLFGCNVTITPDRETDDCPVIYPDYANVVIPPDIAPLNFKLDEEPAFSSLMIRRGDYQIDVKGDEGRFVIPEKKWKKLLSQSGADSIAFTILVKKENEWISYRPFYMYVAKDPIDDYLVYRLIPPGYELWNKMGIYQRNLSNFDQSPVMENKLTGNNCMNCHSFCMNNPDKMLFHMRQTYPGTVLINGDKIEKLETKTPETVSSLVYPSWHPSGKYVAFSVNETKQAFHKYDRNRVEVYDESSDVVVYDTEKHEIVTSDLLFSKQAYETFPSFSPDGKTLFFCTASARPIPAEFDQIKYSLCSVSFDPETRVFGKSVDTLYNAETKGKSVSFPRVSPDGRFLTYTLSGYGNFSIWHKDADLYMVDLGTGVHKPLSVCNSEDVESYHSWSSNSRWMVFSSRRLDGLYTHPYIAYLDDKGEFSKPFMLPQKDPDFYRDYMYSFNIPEFVTSKVKDQSFKIATKVKKEQSKSVNFVK